LALKAFSKAKTMTFSPKSSSPPAVPHIEQFHDPPQLTLVDVLAMQTQAQAQAPSSSGGGFATMPIWTGGDAAFAFSEEREALALAAMVAVLNDGIIPAGRNRNTPDRPNHNTPQNSPSEPSPQ
jgi:hypothetical protein